ncbi:hypothetical protein PFTANZ_06107 [Plasmodium falciparum Tanzania (2000708)]|uniref:Uncharacterized protein n=1 Tax=Plasmodium falciparum Tanzania (2000708) TaxID=1036725 RepID=A0A024VXX3_PLAFA|nr:hypothetical protein PFTANZ_06107 [Plasmodium falciparum Tanzania (2000708)]
MNTYNIIILIKKKTYVLKIIFFIKLLVKQYICYNKCIDTKLFAILKQITNKQKYTDAYHIIRYVLCIVRNITNIMKQF